MNKVILLDKPEGLTSQQAVSLVKRRMGIKKAGHTGTLDPMATGLLIVCTGEVTKVCRFLTDMPKKYETTIKFGERTDTLDACGAVTETGHAGVDMAALEDILAQFRGRISQTPPMYSALKMAGRPLYELARQGIEVAREAREVEIEELKLLAYEPPFARLLISCSKGTYVRTLADDIGVKAGTFAHVTQLRRTSIGPFDIKDAATPDELEILKKPSAFLDIDQALDFLQEVTIEGEELKRIQNGSPFRTRLPLSGSIMIKEPGGKLLAIGEAVRGLVKIERLLHL